MAALRLGLAGAGRMGRNHLRAIAGSAVVKVTAIAEPVASTRSLLQGADSALYGSLDDMLDTAPIDAVLVCVPSDLHLTTIKRLVDAHMPTLCEKPVGVAGSEAREAAALIDAAGLPFQVGFWRRFVPSLMRLRERIARGELGDIYAVANFQWDGAPPGANFRAHSGGIFVDMGVHEFDQTRWLVQQEFGAITSVVSGIAGERWPGDPESAHAIRAVIDEAVKARDRGESPTILFNLSGHGLLDLGAYDAYFAGTLSDVTLSEARIQELVGAL